MTLDRIGLAWITAACLLTFGGTAEAQDARYLYVWAADEDQADTDFLAIIDADPSSPTYAQLLDTVPVGFAGRAHHTEHTMPEGGRLFVNSFYGNRSFLLDLRNLDAPRVAASFGAMDGYRLLHSFDRLPNGNVLATFQQKGETGTQPGGLVELTQDGDFVRGGDAADPVDPELRPYSLLVLPDQDRVITTNADMFSELFGTAIQFWRLSDFQLLKTLPLPPGPRGNEHVLPAEPRRVGTDGTIIMNTFSCGLYRLDDVAGEAPSGELVYSFPFQEDPRRNCALPVVDGSFWIQTVQAANALVSVDVSDPEAPRTADELSFGEGARPHWISGELSGHRIVLTGFGTLLHLAQLVELDPDSGRLSVISEFRDPGSDRPGIRFDRDSWPHGDAGPAVPHGAVFSRR